MTPYFAFAGLPVLAQVLIPGDTVPTPVPMKSRLSRTGKLSHIGGLPCFVLVNGTYYRCQLTVKLVGLNSETWPGGPKELPCPTVKSSA